jgi:hypothetical protein
MIFLIGGAPRAGKSILAERISFSLRVSWISTDLLVDLLRVNEVKGVKSEWDATPDAIRSGAEWFFPSLERFIWGVNLMIEDYIIEGVDFLPAQVQQLSTRYPVRSVFLGRSWMTLQTFDRFPGRSQGYARLPEETRRRIVTDVPLWSDFIQHEAEQWSQPYCDMADDFARRLTEAEALLTAGL